MNLSLLLDMAVSGFGERVVVGDREGGITAADLAARAGGGAALIAGSGARSVVYLARNGPAFPVALFAAAKAGVPLVPLNYRLAPERLRDMVVANEPALIIAEERMVAGLGKAGARVLTPGEWLETTTGEAPVSGPDGDPALVLYTSGTTAEPKAAVLRHEHLTSYVLSTLEFASAGADE